MAISATYTPLLTTQTAIEGSTVTFAVTATESNGVALLYKWQKRDAQGGGNVFTDIAGATTSTYTTPSLVLSDNGDAYRCIVYTITPNQTETYPSSAGWTLNVVASTILLKQVDLVQTISTSVGGTISMEVQSTYSGAAADNQTNVELITYQWQYRVNSTSAWVNVTAGAQSGGGIITITNDTTTQATGGAPVYFRRSTLLFQNVPFSQNLYQYRAVISSVIATNSPLSSDVATIVVGASITITKQPGAAPDVTTIYKSNPVYGTGTPGWQPNGTTTLTVTASSTAGLFSNLTYAWEYRYVATDDYSPVSGGGNILFSVVSANSATLQLFDVKYLPYFELRCIISGSAGEPSIVTNSTQITTLQTVVMSSDPSSASATDGDIVSFSAAVNQNQVSGTAGPVQCKWQRKNPNSSTWNDVTPYTTTFTPSYVTPAVFAATDNGAYYRVQVDGQNCTNEPFYSPNANGVLLSVFSFITISADPIQSSVYQNQVASFAVNATTSNNSVISYQWQYRTSNTAAWTNLANDSQYTGVTTNILLVYNTTVSMTGYQYRCVLNAPGTISSITTTGALLIVQADTFTYIAPINDIDLFQNQALNFEGNAVSRSLSAVAYQWQFKYSAISTATIIGQDIAITSTQAYTVGGTSYPVRGNLWVPTSLSAASLDVVVCYHPTIMNNTTTILEASNNMMNIMKNQVNIKDKIIFSVAYPQDALTVAQNINLLTAAELANFKLGDNLTYARAALLWAKNSLNAFMAANAITKTIANVYMFGHSQGGALVHRLNTLETTNGAIASAPGPIRLDLTCAAVESVSGTNTTCNKLFAAYGTANATPLTSNQYYQRSMQPYVTGHLAPITYLQALDDAGGSLPGNPNSGQPYWMSQLTAAMTANAQTYTYISLYNYGINSDANHAAFVTNNTFKDAIRTVVQSSVDWINISGATNASFSIASVVPANSGYYRYRVTSAGGHIDYSNFALVGVTGLNINIVNNTGPAITVLEGQNNAAILKVTATPSVNSDLTYQWQYNTNPTGTTGWAAFATGFAGSSPTEPIYVPLALSRSQTGLRCRCAITGTGIPGIFYSSETVINVNRRFTYVPIPIVLTIASNQYDTIDLAPTTTGGNPQYQWQYRTSSTAAWTNAVGYTTPQLDILGFAATNQLPAAGSLIVNNNWQIRCLVTLDQATQYQFFNQTTGTQTVPITPAGSQFVVNKDASPDLTSTVNLIPNPPEYVLYSKQNAKSGCAIGTVMCIPKPGGYVYPGETGGDDIMLWNRPAPPVATSSNAEKLKYDRRFIGWIPLGAAPLMASGNKVAGAILNAAEFPELSRIIGTTFGGVLSTSTSAAGFLPPKTGLDGTGGGVTGTFGLPLVYGKHLMGTGGVNNNAASVTVITRYDPKSVAASLNGVGYVGGEYNYNQSNQLPAASGGIAGTDILNPNTFTLGTFQTTGWGDISSDIPTTFQETIQYSIGPLSEKTFNTPTQHGHFLQSFAACPDGGCQKIGRWDQVGNSCGAQQITPLIGLMIEGIGYVSSSESHSHNLATVDASADATGLGSGGGSAGSPTLNGSLNASATGSFLNSGELRMSNQSNSLWNSALSFTLQNAERIAIATPIHRLKYYIKAW